MRSERGKLGQLACQDGSGENGPHLAPMAVVTLEMVRGVQPERGTQQVRLNGERISSRRRDEGYVRPTTHRYIADLEFLVLFMCFGVSAGMTTKRG